MIEFGEKLKRLREEKGMTQQTLAEQLYVTRQAVSRWECGARYPDLLTAKKIAGILETSIDELVSGEEYKRDVEKEQVLAAPKEALVQIVLYAIGVMPYVIMCLFSIKSFFPDEVLKQTPAGQVTILNVLTFMEYLLKMLAMGGGLIWALRRQLSPEKVGIIMAIPFGAEAIVLGTQYINELVNGNMTVGVLWPDVLWRLAAVACTLFFFSKKGSKKCVLSDWLPICVYGITLLKVGVLAQYVRHKIIYHTELGYAVGTVRLLGEVAFVVLLVVQVYVLGKKRRAIWRQSTLDPEGA